MTNRTSATKRRWRYWGGGLYVLAIASVLTTLTFVFLSRGSGDGWMYVSLLILSWGAYLPVVVMVFVAAIPIGFLFSSWPALTDVMEVGVTFAMYAVVATLQWLVVLGIVRLLELRKARHNGGRGDSPATG